MVPMPFLSTWGTDEGDHGRTDPIPISSFLFARVLIEERQRFAPRLHLLSRKPHQLMCRRQARILRCRKAAQQVWPVGQIDFSERTGARARASRPR